MNENIGSNIDPLKGTTSEEVGPEAAAVERLGRMGKNTYDEKMGAAVMMRQRQKLEEALQAANLLEEDGSVDEFLEGKGTSVEGLITQYEEIFAGMNASQLGALVKGMTGDDELAEKLKNASGGNLTDEEKKHFAADMMGYIKTVGFQPMRILMLAIVAGVLLTPPLSNTAEASDLSNIISGINFSLSAIKQYENGKGVPVDSLIDEILQNKVSQGLSSKDRQSLLEASRVIRNAGLRIVKPTNGQPSSSVGSSMGVNQPVTQAERSDLDLAKQYLVKVGVGNSNYANKYESQQKSNDAIQEAIREAYAREQSRNDQQWNQTQEGQKLVGKVRDLKIKLSRLNNELRQARIDYEWRNSEYNKATVKSLSAKIPKAENELAVAEENLGRFNKNH